MDPIIKIRSFEISLTDHCNLSCKGCNHASPHFPKRITELEVIKRDLNALKGVVEASEIRIAGGEPLQHPELVELLQVVKESGVAKNIILISNGLLIKKAPEGIWDLIDMLSISAYPNIKYNWTQDEIQEKCNQHGVRFWYNVSNKFHLTMINRPLSESMANFVYRNCSIVHESSCHLVYEGKFYLCTPAAFMQERLGFKGIEFDNKDEDSVSLHDNPSLREELLKMLTNKKKPLKACTYCLGSMGKEIQHHQLNKKGLKEELEESHDSLTSIFSVNNILRSVLIRPVRSFQFFDKLKKVVRYK